MTGQHANRWEILIGEQKQAVLPISFHLWQFLLRHYKIDYREGSADLRLYTQARWQSLPPPPRRRCFPDMIDDPISNLPFSLQRVEHFYFSFLDQCLFLVRKCSGRRFLDLSCAFPCNFFISDTCLWHRNTYCHFNINI